MADLNLKTVTDYEKAKSLLPLTPSIFSSTDQAGDTLVSRWSKSEAEGKAPLEFNRAKSEVDPFLWVEASLGQGGLSWLVQWTAQSLQKDTLRRPALWVDSSRSLHPSSISELKERLLIVCPQDPTDALSAAEIAIKTSAFCLIAVEMHRHLHPLPLTRLAREAKARSQTRTPTQVILWGQAPSFILPPLHIQRYFLPHAP